jgi:branched-chain amino acid transport system substrate-binding protein
MNMAIAATAAMPQPGNMQTVKRLLALGALLFLAACQSVIPKGGQVPVSTPQEPVNVVAADGDRHRVALLLPVTGPDAEIGQSIANATTLALLDTRNSSIRMTTYDTALGVDAAARKAVSDGNRLILGPLRSDDVIGVSRVATPARVPIISFSNDVGSAGQNVFLLGHLPNQSIDRVVRFAKAKGLNRFAGIVPKTVYGQRALSNLTKSVRDSGGTLVTIQEVDASVASMDAAAKKIRAAGAVDAVMIADSGRTAINMIPALRRNGVSAQRFLGTDLWNLDGTLSSSPSLTGAWFASVSDAMYRQYADKYRARFGTAPNRLSSLGYDSVLLVARVAQNWKVGTAFPSARLTDPEGFIGIDGAFRFLSNGVSERMLEVQEVQKGKFVTIDPASRSFLTAAAPTAK